MHGHHGYSFKIFLWYPTNIKLMIAWLLNPSFILKWLQHANFYQYWQGSMVNQNNQYSYVNKFIDPMGTQSSPSFETRVKYKWSLNDFLRLIICQNGCKMLMFGKFGQLSMVNHSNHCSFTNTRLDIMGDQPKFLFWSKTK